MDRVHLFRRHGSREADPLQASRKTVLYNGALECRLYEYRIVAGGNRR
jgi:hypothetical protein